MSKKNENKKSAFDTVITFLENAFGSEEDKKSIYYSRLSRKGYMDNDGGSIKDVSPIKGVSVFGGTIKDRILNKTTSREDFEKHAQSALKLYSAEKKNIHHSVPDIVSSSFKMFGVHHQVKCFSKVVSEFTVDQVVDKAYSYLFDILSGKMEDLYFIDDSYRVKSLAFVKQTVQIMAVEAFIDEYIRAAQTAIPFSDFKYSKYMRKGFENDFEVLEKGSINDIMTAKFFIVERQKNLLNDLIRFAGHSRFYRYDDETSEEVVESVEKNEETKTPEKATPKGEIKCVSVECPETKKVGFFKWMKFFLFGVN